MDCQWDWRSLQCESHCHCSFQWQVGDYHLGRACRRYRSFNNNNTSSSSSSLLDEVSYEMEKKCIPTTYIIDQPIPRRIVSLVRQTTDILRQKIQHIIQSLFRRSQNRYQMIQQQICSDLYSQLYVTLDGTQCWVVLPESLTLLEQIICGRNLHRTIPACPSVNHE